MDLLRKSRKTIQELVKNRNRAWDAVPIPGIYSSRQIAAATYERINFRALTGDQHPFHTAPFSRIRKANPRGDCAESTLGENPTGNLTASIEGLFGASS